MNAWVQRVRRFLSRHMLVIALGAVLTFILQGPLSLFPLLEGRDYQGINIAHFGTDEHYYLLRTDAVLEGISPGNPVLQEEVQAVDHTFSYVEKILFSPLIFLGLSKKVSAVDVVNTYNTLGIFLLLLLIYAFVLRLIGSRAVALAASLFVVGGYSLVYHKSFFYDDFNIYGRMMFPLLSSLCFFLYFNLLVLAIQSGKRVHAIFSGILFGLSFYLYYFLWTFTFVATALLVVWYFIRRQKVEITQLCTVFGVGLAIGSYNIFRLFEHFASSEGSQSSYVAWVLHTHRPVFSLTTLIVCAVFAFFLSITKKITTPFVAVSGALILAGVISLNEQVLTGVQVQYGHYYWYFVVPAAIIIFIATVWQLLPKGFYRNTFVVVLVVSALLNSAVGQYLSYFTTFSDKHYEQYFAPLLRILNTDTVPKVVFASDNRDSSLVPLYTPHFLFWHHQALEGGVSLARLKESLFTYVYFTKEGRSNFYTFLSRELSKNDASMYAKLFEDLEGIESGFDYYVYRAKVRAHDSDLFMRRAVLLKDLEREYGAFQSNPNVVVNVLKKRNVAYILWDKNKNPEWDISFLQSTSLIGSSHGVSLYRVF